MREFEVDVEVVFRYRIRAEDEAEVRAIVEEGVDLPRVYDVYIGPDVVEVREVQR